MGDLSDCAVLVVDALRATTTMPTMLARGAEAVLPVADLERAYNIKMRDSSVLLAGERNNVPPEGFDGGNSPFSYTEELVSGRRIIFTTTNGTQAIERVSNAPWVGCASVVNAEASATLQQKEARHGVIVCAGTKGNVSLEDVLAAGAIVDYWPKASWTDSARIAHIVYERYRDSLGEGFHQADHAQSLRDTGDTRDIEFAASLNIVPVVPVRQINGWFRPG